MNYERVIEAGARAIKPTAFDGYHDAGKEYQTALRLNAMLKAQSAIVAALRELADERMRDGGLYSAESVFSNAADKIEQVKLP